MTGVTERRAPFRTLNGVEPCRAFGSVKTPAYVIDRRQLEANGHILQQVSQLANCKILLAQKAFSNYDFYPLLSQYLSGTEASGLFEARLGREEMPGKEVHVFSAAYRKDEFNALLSYADHIVFNSIRQLKMFGPRAAGKSLGLRINPEHSVQRGSALYDPCAPGSRLGVTRENWDRQMDSETFDMLEGIHFHTLCEQNSDALKEALQAVDDKFGDVISRLKWINMGGGHHITRPGYDLNTLYRCISDAQDKWGVAVYLEPGEAVALNAGFLVTHILDLVHSGGCDTAIMDCSPACHMPDVIEMPYTPPVFGAAACKTADKPFHYRLAGPTCLAGDVVGDYWFSNKLKAGDMLVFGDMAIYTSCKTNMFNGMPLPDIWERDKNGVCAPLTHFGYRDFKSRLGTQH